MTRYAFYFDSSSCSGCKACQAACKDKNELPVGMLWRRVYEVSGGAWYRNGEAWVSTVFAYNLSLACNHCQRPICMEVCPVRAFSQREDGIVLLDSSKCVGCKYCLWACPYGALQYDTRLGRMTKCNFCVDNIDRGAPPACVAACPLRALDFGDLDELKARYAGVQAVHPLPDGNITGPAIIITPHKDSLRAGNEHAQISNWEEVAGRPDE